jgi:thioredoxin-related protein
LRPSSKPLSKLAKSPLVTVAVLAASLLWAPARAVETGTSGFNDKPLQEALVLPDWFKLSFLELHDDLKSAIDDGKRGLIVYFGQEHCPYCKAQLENNWGRRDIREYTQKYFDVVAINVRGSRRVTDLDGNILTEKEFAIRQKANFTPTLLFYDRDGRIALKLAGYHRPYQFRAALEYVADGHYRKQSFRDFLALAEPGLATKNHGLHSSDVFSSPPYALDRSHVAAQVPLAVFYEQASCYACDVLHGGPMEDPEILRRLRKLEVVQLDLWGNTPVITPGGKHLTAKKWGEELGLFYTPTILFFDPHGKEILRLDSVIGFHRLRNVLDYILSGDYTKPGGYGAWRNEHTPK